MPSSTPRKEVYVFGAHYDSDRRDFHLERNGSGQPFVFLEETEARLYFALFRHRAHLWRCDFLFCRLERVEDGAVDSGAGRVKDMSIQDMVEVARTAGLPVTVELSTKRSRFGQRYSVGISIDGHASHGIPEEFDSFVDAERYAAGIGGPDGFEMKGRSIHLNRKLVDPRKSVDPGQEQSRER